MKEKTVSDAVNFRRSVRVYDPEKTIDTEKVKKCIEQATLAPSSSNLQLWEFYHIQSEEFLKEVAKVCYNQPAAKTVGNPCGASRSMAATHSSQCGFY